MNKNLIALAVAAALVAPAATMAGDIKVYGQAQAELSNATPEDSTKDSKLSVVDNSRGRLGVVASEDLGNGWKGLAKFEFKADTADNNADKCTASSTTTVTDVDGVVIDTDSDGNADTVATTTTCSAGASLAAREAMVGLKGKSGQFEIGNLKQAYKYAGGVKYDPFVGTTLEARGNGGMSTPKTKVATHKSFHNNAIAFRSGALGPVKVQLTYGPTTDDGSMSASIMYKQGGIQAFVAVADGGDLSEDAATKIGGQFKSGANTISAQFEQTDNGTTEPTVMFLGYQMKMGKNTFVAQYGATDADGGDDMTYLTLGAIHKFSKMTRVFGGFRSTTSDSETAGTDVVTVGLRKDFK